MKRDIERASFRSLYEIPTLIMNLTIRGYQNECFRSLYEIPGDSKGRMDEDKRSVFPFSL